MVSESTTNIQWSIFCQRGKEIIDFLRPYVVLVANPTGQPEDMGSGVLVTINDRHFVFTAGHIAKAYRAASPIALGLPGVNRGSVVIRSEREPLWDYDGDQSLRDCGVIELAGPDVARIRNWSNADFLTTDRFAICSAAEHRGRSALFLISGFPEYSRTRGPASEGRGGQRTIESEFLLMGAAPTAHVVSATVLDLMAPRDRGVDPETRAVHPVPSFGGVSGGPAWVYTINEATSQAEFSLVGTHAASDGQIARVTLLEQHLTLLDAAGGL
jgi:hypothetical protein